MADSLSPWGRGRGEGARNPQDDPKIIVFRLCMRFPCEAQHEAPRWKPVRGNKFLAGSNPLTPTLSPHGERERAAIALGGFSICFRR